MKKLYVEVTEVVNWKGYIEVTDDFDLDKAKKEESDSNHDWVSDDYLNERLLEAQNETMFVEDCDGMILRHIEQIPDFSDC